MEAWTWDRLRDICVEALALPPDDRSAYLDRVCAGDAALRSEVEELLAHHDPDFLEEPLMRIGDEGEEVTGHGVPVAPSRLGSYRLVRPIGRGGMGEVFLAVQEGEGFERPVALKLIRAGMATEDVLARFALERRILAGLNHPNLARLIDGGATDDGMPYFVMEYVDGVPITDYCADRNADVRERLELFVAVCDAVHHAHQSLVVHRDIKPSNILVTREGRPKLLDFGIGKVLDPAGETDRTMTIRRVLTPEYAAPEQVRGAPITTATDVHGLGLLLYELLTGRHPYVPLATTPEEFDRVLVETTPTQPSVAVAADPGLRRSLRGDLDNIVLMALRKEPERRYASVEAFRADVRRYLEGRPVTARPASFGYRASKFVARNPWAVAAMVAGGVAVSTAIVVPWRQNQRLTVERDRALAVQNFLLEGFGTTGGDQSIGARDLLDRQAERVDASYGDQPAIHADMLLALSDAYERLGLYDDAIGTAERALGVLRTSRASDAREMARALNALGWALHQAGRSSEAEAPLTEAITIRRDLGRDARGELSRALNDLGVVMNSTGRPEEGESLHREALALRAEVLGNADMATGVSANNLAASLYLQGRYAEAGVEGERAVELLRTSMGPDHQRTIIAQNNLAVFMVQTRDFAGAVEVYRDLLDRQGRLQGADHPVTNTIRHGLGSTLRHLGEVDESEQVLRDAIEVARGHGDAGVDQRLTAMRTLSLLLVDMERTEEAVAVLDDAIEIARVARPDGTGLEDLYLRRSNLLREMGDHPEAARDREAYVALRAGRLAEDDERLAVDRIRLASFWLRAGEPSRAGEVLARVRPLVDRLPDDARTLFARVDSVRVAGGG